MTQVTDWWDRSQFIREYFLGSQRQIAHELATSLAERFVRGRIFNLRPETNLLDFLAQKNLEYQRTIGALIYPGIKDSLDLAEFLMAVEEETGEEIEMDSLATFRGVVRAVQIIRTLSI